MLLKFETKNYKSFVEKIQFSMIAVHSKIETAEPVLFPIEFFEEDSNKKGNLGLNMNCK